MSDIHTWELIYRCTTCGFLQKADGPRSEYPVPPCHASGTTIPAKLPTLECYCRFGLMCRNCRKAKCGAEYSPGSYTRCTLRAGHPGTHAGFSVTTHRILVWES
jgi:hypothetical protein